jgi:hypothetical protein
MRLLRSCAVFAVASAAGALALLVDESDAHAQYYVYRRAPDYGVALNLGLDIEGAGDVTPPAQTSTQGGGGLKIRVGAEIHRPWLRIIPEAGFGYTHLFVEDTFGNNVGWNMERLFVGARVGFGEVIVPVIYGHIGYGWRATSDEPPGIEGVPNASGLTADGGLALDFHLIRHVGFGLHIEYVTVQSTPSVPDWIAGGAHADFRF